MKKYSSTEEYIEAHPQWKIPMESLQKILLSVGLEEKIKWGIPVYCIDNKNVVSLGAFKDYCGLWFFYGSILEDPHNKLHAAQESTKHLRHWRIFEGETVDENAIKACLLDAINKVDLAPKPEKNKKVTIPELLKEKLEKSAGLKKQFEAFTPFKQKEFCEHIASAKQEKTKLYRLEKILPMIENGIGLHDKYRNC